MNTGILAFCASKKSGKSTSFEFLKEAYSGEIEELALAGHLKKVCAQVFNIDMQYFTDQDLKERELNKYVVLRVTELDQIYKEFGVYEQVKQEYNKYYRDHNGKVLYTPRKLLQYIGTEVLHPIDPLIHVKTALRIKDKNKLTVVTDLRFKAEYDYFLTQNDYDFKPFYIKNNLAEEAAKADLHPSERQLELFKDECLVIDNNGSLGDLKNQINNLVSLYLETKNEQVNT